MKKPKIGLRILACIFEIIFVVVFIVAGIMTPTVGMADGLINGNTLGTIIEEVDFGEVFYEAFKESAGEEMAQEFGSYLSTDFAKDVVNSYTGNLAKFLKGEEYVNVDSDFVSQKYDEHEEEMLNLLYSKYPEAKNDKGAANEFKEQVVSLFEMLPPIDELTEQLGLSDATLSVIASINKTKLIAIIGTILIAVLIVVISLYKGNGFVWLAVALIIPMVCSIAIGFADASAITSAGLGLSEGLTGVVTQVVANLTGAFKTAGLVYAIVFVVSIVLKVIMTKKANKNEALTTEATAQ